MSPLPPELLPFYEELPAEPPEEWLVWVTGHGGTYLRRISVDVLLSGPLDAKGGTCEIDGETVRWKRFEGL